MTTAPVLDTEALDRLGEQLGDTDIFCGFICRYVAMLGQRIQRLERALSAQDHEGWMDAVLSLKTSSALAGAQALSTLAARLQEGAEHSGSPPWVRWCAAGCRAEVLEILRGVATETAHQLRAFLQQSETAATPTP